MRAQMGSADAFEVLVRELGPRLHRYLTVRLGNDADARDALQETLLAAWQELPRLRRPDRFWPWVTGIAAHKAADGLRRRRAVVPSGEDEGATAPDSDLSYLRAAIQALPAHERDVVLLRYVAGLSEQEVANAIGVRVGTVKSRAFRARSRLADLIDE